MKTKFVYGIFPYDDTGKVAGVYVGITEGDVNRRMTNHLRNYNSKHGLRDLHELMRTNGFHWVILATVDYKERCVEYDWIDYFSKKTDLKVFNYKLSCAGADWHKIGGER